MSLLAAGARGAAAGEEAVGPARERSKGVRVGMSRLGIPLKDAILWVVAKSISHHFEAMGSHLFVGICRGSITPGSFHFAFPEKKSKF